MSTQLISLDTGFALPAHLQAFATEGNEFGFSGSPYPRISLKGKVFTIERNKEKSLITKPGTDDEPASSIEVVILNAGPKQGYAKTFYSEGFQEGSAAKPTCYSMDGLSPATDAEDRQASKCALCPKNAKGSGATNQNPKAKACKSSKLLAVAPAGALSDPMLLRVPGGSTIDLSKYGEMLAKRGIKAAAVVTKISFDYTVAHPALTFKPVGGITPDMATEVLAIMNSDLVKVIIGEKSSNTLPFKGLGGAEDGGEETPVVSAPPPAPVAKASAKPTSTFATSPAEAAPAEVKAEKKKKAAPVTPAPVVAELAGDAELDKALDTISFDD